MPTQSTVSIYSGYGVPGDRYDDSPIRSLPYTLNSADANNNIIGATFFTLNVDGSARAGGTGPLAGFLINSKLYALRGTPAGGTLAPTLQLPNFTEVEMATMGRFFATFPAAANIGDLLVYDTTTGLMSTVAPNAALPVGKAFAQGQVSKYPVTSPGGLGVIELTTTLVRPV